MSILPFFPLLDFQITSLLRERKRKNHFTIIVIIIGIVPFIDEDDAVNR
jgi:hypothetical protein